MHATRLRLLARVCLVLAIVALAALPGSAQVPSWSPNFDGLTVGSTASTTVEYTFGQMTAIAMPAVVTQGAPGLDFKSTGGTCTAKTYSPGQTCTVDVTFTPSNPGLRMGAVVFFDPSGTMISTTYLQGVGIGTLPVLPAVSSASGLSFRPLGVAVDAAANVYLAGDDGGLRQLDSGLSGVTRVVNGFSYPVGVAVDGAGIVYVADSTEACVWKVLPDGSKTKFVSSVDSWGVAVDGGGNLYIPDRNTGSVLKVAPDGSQTTAVDNINFLVGPIAVDGAGNIYVSDSHTTTNYVWKVAPGGERTQVWTGSNQASGVAVDGVGNLYVTDGNLWKVPPDQAQVQVYTGVTPFLPRSIALDGDGNAYITDISANRQIVKLGGVNFFPLVVNGACGEANGGTFNAAPATNLCSAGTPSAVAGGGTGSWTWSCAGAGGSTTASCSASIGDRVKFLTPPPSILSVVGNAGKLVVAIADSLGTVATGSTAAITLSVTGLGGYSQSYSANAVNGQVSFDLSAVTLTTPDIYTYTASSPGLTPATAIENVAPGQHTKTGVIMTVAGTGIAGYNGDDIPATTAQLNYPEATALDGAGNIYIADSSNHRVRVVCVVSSGAFCSGRTAGNIYTVAGNGNSGFFNGSDGVLATTATLGHPATLALDSAGNLFIGETQNQMVFEVDATTHTITRFAGTWSYLSICASATNGVGDGCPATSGYLAGVGITFNTAGDLLVADGGTGGQGWSRGSGHHLVRVVSGGSIHTVAGCGTAFAGKSGGDWSWGDWCDGTQDSNLQIGNSVAQDRAGNTYFNNTGSGLIRKMDATTGLYAVVAGGGSNWCNGRIDQYGDGCPATSVMFYGNAIALDSANNLYITDGWGSFGLIRQVDAATQILTTVAGSWLDPCGSTKNAVGDGCPATSAKLASPAAGVALDAFDNIYIADAGNNRIRKVTTWLLTPTFNLPASQTINGGTPSITISGTIGAGTVYPHDAETVTITINGLSVLAPITGGGFSATFDTSALAISATPYPITYAYAEDDVLGSVSDSSTTLTVRVTPLPMTITANDQTMIFGGAMPPLTYTVSPNVALDTAPTCVPTTFPGAITCSGAVKANYDITYVPGWLTVIQGTPILSVAPASLDFGSQPLGTTTVAQTITLTNSGDATWSPNTIGPGANTIDDFTVTGGSCITSGSVLVPGASCTVDVTFSPWLAGSRSGAITITDDSANSPYIVALSGTGVLPNGVLAALPAGILPMRIAVNSNTNKMYVANSGSTFVTVISGDNNTASNVDVGAPTSRVVVNRETNKIYFTGTTVPYFVIVMDGRDNSTTRLDFQNRPTDVVVDAVRNKIYVPVDTNDATTSYVAVIDGASNSMTSILLGGMPLYAAVNPVSNKIYVTMYGRWTTVIDAATGATSSVQPQDRPFWVVANPAKNKIYVSSWDNGTSVTVIDGVTDTPTTITTGKNPNALAVNTVTNKIYVANSSDTTITVINGNDNSTQTVDVGTSPFYVAVNEITNQVYVGNSEDKTVTVVDGVTNATSSLPADRPWPVAVNPVTNTVYVGNRRAASGAMNGNVFVIQGAAAPAQLTITANEQTMTYGSTVPALTYTVTPSMPLDTPPICVSTATSSSYVDTYPTAITCSGASKAGYSISYVPAPMTVTKAELTIIFNDATKTYGQTSTFAGTEFTTSGLVNGDSVHGCTLTSPGAAATAPVSGSPYAITFSSGAWGSVGLSNYHNTYVSGTLTVTKAALTITAMSSTKTYGDVVTFAGVEFTTSGLINGDVVNNVTLTSAGTVATAAVSSYSIIPNNAAGTGIGSYTISYVNGTLTVGRALLTVTANNRRKAYGTAALFLGTEFAVVGLTNGDNVTSVTLNSTGAPAAATVGNYDIVPGGAIGTGLSNYGFTYVKSILTVDKATLIVTANDKQRTYGASNPPLDGTLSGLALGDNITVTYWTPATASSPLGTYLIEPSAFHDLDGKLPNYAWTLVNGTLTVVPASVDFGAKDVPSSSRQMATLAFAAAGRLNSISVVTQGTEQLDFGEDIIESGTCTLGTSYAAGDTCTVNVVFRPHYPGRSMGAVLLKNAGGTVLSTVYVQGSGNGALLVLNPRSQTTVATSVLDPHGVAADAAGNVYIADTGHNQVVKVSSVRPDDRVILGNVSTPVGTGLLQPHGVAVDGAGNVYIANTLGDTVVKVPADGSAQTTVGTGLLQPHGVAVDGAGNVYIADTGNSRAVKVPADGSAQITVGTGLNTPQSIAVDGAGNVYIADSYHNDVVKVPADGSAQTTVGTGLLHPQGVGVDALGNVYVADTVNNRVVKVSADGGAQTTIASAPTATATSTGVKNPSGVAVDGGGNVYIADADLVRRLDWTSQDSGVVTVENDGNRPLIFDSIGFPLGDVTTTCSTSSALTGAATCRIGVLFTATTVELVDNGRPGNPLLSVQRISLGDNVPPTIGQQFGAASIPMNGSTSLTFTIRNTNSSLTLAGVEFYASLPSGGLVVATPSNLKSTCQGTATATDGSSSVRLTGASLAPGTFCTVSVNVAGANTPGVFDSNVTVSSTNRGTGNTSSESLVVVPGAILTVIADNKAMAYGGSLPTLTATLSGFVNGDTAAVVIGAAACSTTASSSSSGGTYPITCTAGTLSATNYTFSSFVGGTLTIWTPPTSAAVSIAYLDPVVTRAWLAGLLSARLWRRVRERSGGAVEWVAAHYGVR